jgi:hypothetical protein
MVLNVSYFKKMLEAGNLALLLFAVNAYASNDSKSKALAKQPVVEQKNAGGSAIQVQAVTR